MTRSRNTAPLLLLVLLLLAIPSAASAGPVVHPVDQSAGGIRAYWTKARMRAAQPVPTSEAAGRPEANTGAGSGQPSATKPSTYVPAAAPGSDAGAELLRGSRSPDTSVSRRAIAQILDPDVPGTRAHGKVFFTIPKGIDAGNFVCSGTAINSRNRSVVLTAGHCVFDSQTGGGAAINWAFVPAYSGGAEPYGEWPARKLATTKQWRTQANLRYDLGAAVVRRNNAGKQLQSVVGARGIGFDQRREQTFNTFGYPAVLPFTGEFEYLCDSPNQGTDTPGGQGPNTMSILCPMTGGASGGGWIVGKRLLSITSYGYPNQPGILYGPYLSTTAKKLYKKVRGR